MRTVTKNDWKVSRLLVAIQQLSYGYASSSNVPEKIKSLQQNKLKEAKATLKRTKREGKLYKYELDGDDQEKFNSP